VPRPAAITIALALAKAFLSSSSAVARSLGLETYS
jgi:hypothetical protein